MNIPVDMQRRELEAKAERLEAEIAGVRAELWRIFPGRPNQDNPAARAQRGRRQILTWNTKAAAQLYVEHRKCGWGVEIEKVRGKYRLRMENYLRLSGEKPQYLHQNQIIS